VIVAIGIAFIVAGLIVIAIGAVIAGLLLAALGVVDIVGSRLVDRSLKRAAERAPQVD
jgi:hypothetical protein